MLAQLEGVSQQIEQAKMLEKACESETDSNKAVTAGTHPEFHNSILFKLLLIDLYTVAPETMQPEDEL